MNLQELEAAQAKRAQQVSQAVLLTMGAYEDQAVDESLWVALLKLLWDSLRPVFWESARDSRLFFESQRQLVFPGVAVKDVPVAGVSFDRWLWEMEEVRPLMSKAESSAEDLHRVALRAVRSVENVGRRQMLRAVEAPDPVLDPLVEESGSVAKPSRELGLVKGWARVATGAETCSWCIMLCSRGPVYSHVSAGSAVSFEDSLRLVQGGEFDASQHMHQWHTGCDCKVVPVFDLSSDWEGKDRWLAAEELWKEATVGFHGKDALNAFRRAVYRGDYDVLLSGMRVAA